MIVPDDGRGLADGSINGMKWKWWPFEPRTLTIEGHWLDIDHAPLLANIPDGYGSVGLRPVSLIFPSEGCTEITGHLGDHSLTFVTCVFPPFVYSEATPEV